jgi:tetratricopeptide (TPR) repeat protein
LKPFGPDYAFALALSYKMLARHEEALPLFILAGELAEQGMKARMHAAECLLRLQRKQEAIELLRTLLSDAGSDVDPVLKKRAEAWLQLAEQ